MTKEEIKNYVTGLCELNLLDFYNSIACNFYSSDAIIHHNTNQFFRDEFLSLNDAEVSKQSINYKPTDKYVLMLEYMQLKTSSNLYDLINIDELVNLTYFYLAEVLNMGIIQFKGVEFNSKAFLNINNINILNQHTKPLKRLKKVFKGRGKMKGFLFTQIARNDFAMIYEKRNNYLIRYEVFEIQINPKINKEVYPMHKDFGVTAFDVETLQNAVIKFHEITKKAKTTIN